MSETTTNTTEPAADGADGRAPRTADAAEALAHGLFGVGRLWAAHGLNVGRSALEATASTLRTTAALLGELSERFEPRDAQAEGEDRSAA